MVRERAYVVDLAPTPNGQHSPHIRIKWPIMKTNHELAPSPCGYNPKRKRAEVSATRHLILPGFHERPRLRLWSDRMYRLLVDAHKHFVIAAQRHDDKLQYTCVNLCFVVSLPILRRVQQVRSQMIVACGIERHLYVAGHDPAKGIRTGPTPHVPDGLNLAFVTIAYSWRQEDALSPDQRGAARLAAWWCPDSSGVGEDKLPAAPSQSQIYRSLRRGSAG